jgi:hypothetical protein
LIGSNQTVIGEQMIQPVADMLSIPHSRIYANTLLFDNDGTYKGFDPKVCGILQADMKRILRPGSIDENIS